MKCPHCYTVLTESESEGTHCPLCSESLTANKSRASIRSSPSELRNIASAQKLTIWVVLIGLFTWPFSIPLSLYAVWRLADSLNRSPILYMFGILFIPFVGVILLLQLNGEATRRLQDAGVRVGLFGANKSDLNR